ncbi:Phosphotransferase system PTS,fructose specific IIBC component [Mycoplasma mycoides subsp. capri LC str. 95010]|uniref:Phosphotransferase system PTS,fructose specific IIBC component n=1 Tax=Mycoplasma mycoides subsp. capri LC str. 95010 TaxID=862259 RepID=F4MQW8_MYCML|nr:fructose-specific PTS transporter subunit EIIC [Mycoplasma mycoides]CBW54501.1 Phosphotransferase system PTS,fructose specific IIBC component [Mycoplasma mycoides subsp. capri LC str. 95010]
MSNDNKTIVSSNKDQLEGLKNIVAITACAAGVAHTYMAADSISKAAKALNINVHVETQGTIGAENVISDQQLQQADLVIIAADVKIDTSRFNGKKIYITGVNDAIKNPELLIRTAWQQAVEQGKKGTKVGVFTIGATKKKGVLNHLMTGISWVLPLIIAAGILMAIANLSAFQTIYSDQVGDYTQAWVLYERPFPQFLMNVGSLGFKLVIPLFSAFIAYSIADKPGIAPALIGGWIINDNKMLGINVPVSENSSIEPGAGFLGAIIVGLLAGYLVKLLKSLRWWKILKPVVPLMIIPIISVFIISTFVKFVIGAPIANLVLGLFNGLSALQDKFAGTSFVIALVVSMMIAFDLGGPFNKTALVFGTVVFYQSLAQVLSNGQTFWDANFVPGTAAQAAISVPPLGMFLATLLFKKKFTQNERVMGKAAFAQGIVGITEGAIPFAATDPIRVIFANVIGAAVAGVGVTLTNAKFAAGLGSPIGVFLGYIQLDGILGWPMGWIIPILLGILTTALIIGFTKPKIKGEELEQLEKELKDKKLKRIQAHKNFKQAIKSPKMMFALIKKVIKKWWTNYINEVKEFYSNAWKQIKKYFILKWMNTKNFFNRLKQMFSKKK